MLPENRVSTHPGEILAEDFLSPLQISPADFAAHLELPTEWVLEIVAGKRAITPDVAWLFAQALRTTPQFWLNLQNTYDLTSQRPERQVTPLIDLPLA